jgi:hypothetical protein
MIEATDESERSWLDMDSIPVARADFGLRARFDCATARLHHCTGGRACDVDRAPMRGRRAFMARSHRLPPVVAVDALHRPSTRVGRRPRDSVT